MLDKNCRYVRSRTISYTTLSTSLFIALTFLIPAQVGAQNLVTNPGFESGSQGWQKAASGGRTVVTTRAHTGAASLQQDVSTSFGRETYQDVVVVAGANYDASGWLMTSGVTGAGARIELQWLNATGLSDMLPSGSLLRSDVIGSLTGTQPWTQLSQSGLVAPAGAVVVRFRLFTAAGTTTPASAWFDDLSLSSGVVGPPPPDTAPPTVAITAPAGGATVSGTISVSASASDNVGVAGVQFLLDGANLGSEDTVAPYSISWNTTTATNASHTLSAVARDAAGNTATATAVTVTVNNAGDTTPPTVSMTAPSAGAAVKGTITVSASASDNVGVTGVQFLLDGANLGAEDTTAPYSVSWDTTTAVGGSHNLSAVARDAAGNTATAAAVTVTVDNVAPTVSLTAPANGSTVSGSVTVSANASDNTAVAGVQFLLDGANLGAEDTVAPYSISWDTTATANGAHTLSAKARDTAGNLTTAASISVTVSNTVTNFVTNPGFESGSQGWQKAASGGRTVVTTQAHSGAASLQQDVSTSFGRESYQDVAVVATYTYTASGWVMTSGVTGAGARLELQWLNATGLPDVLPSGSLLRTDTLGSLTGTQPWTQLSQSGLVAPAGAVVVRFRLFTAAGTTTPASAWFDDLSLSYTFAPPPDTTAPAVSISSPVSGSTLSTTSRILASATDNVGVAGVQFFVDGNASGAEILAPPYVLTLDTFALTNGAHTITARARDAANNSAVSPAASFVIDNTGRPNIVLVVTDDQRFDTMQYMPLTSSLLSSESVKFSNAFVTTPDCCPSRSSILSGLYSHNTGILQDYSPSGGAQFFNADSTIATWLKDTGYKTGIYGKYLNAYSIISPSIPPGWDDFHVFVRNALTNSDGDFFYDYEINNNGTVVRHGNAPQDYSTNVLGSQVLSFINAAPASQPLFVYFVPYGPHDPVTPDPADIGSYAGIPNWRPASFNEADVSDKPAWIRAFPPFAQTDIDTVDTFRRNQLETLQSVDRQVAAIINALQQTGRWSNTLFIFTSDNGLTWGEHRIINSKFSVYEESVRVPMWVRAPGLASRQDSNMVANIDLAPSIAQWAGVTPPSRVNGLSFVNLLSNPNAPGRSELLHEYLGPTINAALRFQAVRTSQYVYSELFSGERELYDLLNDPLQLTNVYNDPAYAGVIPGLRALLTNLKSQ